MTSAELTQGLPPNEVALLQSNGTLLLKKTPLWYYVLREAAVLSGGNKLGPVGARIVAETFVRMLKRDAVLVPTRPRRIHADSSLGHSRRLHGRRSRGLRRRDPAIKFGWARKQGNRIATTIPVAF